MNPLLQLILSLSLGGSLMGLVGMLIFIPLLSTGYALLREDVNRRNHEPPEKAEELTCEKEDRKKDKK